MHPAAPMDLITAAYWRLADQAQRTRGSNAWSEINLHRLTRAYQTVVDPGSRAAYDLAMGLGNQRLIPRLPGRVRRSHGERAASPAVDGRADYYELLRADPRAEPAVLIAAYGVMRDYYMRMVHLGEAPVELLDFLEEANATVSDPERRRQYDAERAKRAPPPPQPPPVGQAPARRQRRAHRRNVRLSQLGIAAARALGRLLARLAPPARRSVRRLSKAALRLAGIAAAKLYRSLARAGKEAARELAAAIGARFDPSREEPDVDEEEALLGRLSLVREMTSADEDASGDSEFEARLVMIEGASAEKAFALNGHPLTLGSDGESDVLIAGAAPRQARLWYREGRFMVHNVAASPTTLINGRPIVWAVLKDGDVLTAGPCRLRFHVNGG